MPIALAMANQPRYHVVLGDRPLVRATQGLRLVSLAAPEATLAAVRYVQIPQWKELGILAAHVTLSIGQADLLATLGDEGFATAAYGPFETNANAIARELASLREPGTSVELLPCTGLQGWEWETRFNQCVRDAFLLD